MWKQFNRKQFYQFLFFFNSPRGRAGRSPGAARCLSAGSEPSPRPSPYRGRESHNKRAKRRSDKQSLQMRGQSGTVGKAARRARRGGKAFSLFCLFRRLSAVPDAGHRGSARREQAGKPFEEGCPRAALAVLSCWPVCTTDDNADEP